MIIRQLELGHMDNFCYLVGCEKTRKAMMIDPGADVERIMAEAEKERLVIETIVNTHGHADHTAGSAKLKALTGAHIIMHALDAAAVPEADVRLTGDQDLPLGAIRFKVIHTPGHTPGGICLYAAPHLFTGDTMFVGGVGRTDFPGGDPRALARSIAVRLAPLPASTLVHPGHGPDTTIGREQRVNPFWPRK